MLKWFGKDKIEKILLEKTVRMLEDVIKEYQKQNSYLLKKFMGEGMEVVADPKMVFPQMDEEELTAGTILKETKESKDGSDR